MNYNVQLCTYTSMLCKWFEHVGQQPPRVFNSNYLFTCVMEVFLIVSKCLWWLRQIWCFLLVIKQFPLYYICDMNTYVRTYVSLLSIVDWSSINPWFEFVSWTVSHVHIRTYVHTYVRTYVQAVDHQCFLDLTMCSGTCTYMYICTY